MKIAENTWLDAYNIDVKFLNDKYGFDRKLASDLIKDISKGNFESGENNIFALKNGEHFDI